jgi:hypothetical protein
MIGDNPNILTRVRVNGRDVGLGFKKFEAERYAREYASPGDRVEIIDSFSGRVLEQIQSEAHSAA